MKHYAVAILSGDSDIKEMIARSWGKKGTSTDIALHTLAKPDLMTTIIPLRYPDKPIPLVLACHMADVALLPISSKGIDASVAESAILADVLMMDGIRAVIAEGGQAYDSFHAQFEKLFKGSPLITWKKETVEPSDLNTLREDISSLITPMAPSEGGAIIEVDHAFSVQGVGAVILGTILQGTISKGDRIFAFPGNHQGNVRSIQVNDIEVKQAGPRTHVGLAIRGILPKNLERGTVLTTASELIQEVGSFSGHFRLSPILPTMADGMKVHVVAGLYDTPALLKIDDQKDRHAEMHLVMDKSIPLHSLTKMTILDLNAKQRIIGSLVKSQNE
ncbi:MAG: hypothetical protein D6732_19755 [Methanobacteriota archaeon]|nr:MAG: hypothetical protein D6732_19755 [Euryarchaeota archaeon]